MIGFIRVADIPKALLGFVIGIGLLGAFFFLPLIAFPSLINRVPEWIAMVVFFSLIGAGYAIGNRIWKRMHRL